MTDRDIKPENLPIQGDPYPDCDGCQRFAYEMRELEFTMRLQADRIAKLEQAALDFVEAETVTHETECACACKCGCGDLMEHDTTNAAQCPLAEAERTRDQRIAALRLLAEGE